MNKEKYKKEKIEYIADKISPYTVAGCDEDLAEAIFNLVEEENARLKDKIEKAIEEIKNVDKYEETLNDGTRIYMIQDVDVDEIEKILKEK